MTWQDACLTAVSLAFIVALIPSVVRRQVAPPSTCLLTAAGLTIIAAIDLTLQPPLVFTSATTWATAILWWACLAIGLQQKGSRL